MSASKTIDFYFDYLSGYAYFAWLKLKELMLNKNYQVELHPILFAGLLKHWGQLGPAEIPAKRNWVITDWCRYAAIQKLNFTLPKMHPFNPLLALRLSLKVVAQEKQLFIIDHLWRAGWQQGIDLSSESEITSYFEQNNFDIHPYLAKTKDSQYKSMLIKETEDAIKYNIFGIPTFRVDQQIFWGNDRMDHLKLYIQDKDPINLQQVEKLLQHPSGITKR